MHFYIIPGNPPAIYFYKLWAEEIKKEFPESFITISSYPHLPVSHDSFEYLNKTREIHAEALLAFSQKVQGKVIVIGHSLGGWMAFNLLKKHSEIIENCFLLYPFLLRPALKGRTVLSLMHYIHKVPLLEKILLSSRGLLEKLIDPLKYVTDGELRISIALSCHEHRVIGHNKSFLEIPEASNKKLHLLYCDKDTWCPNSTIQEMKKTVSCQKTDTSHDFITYPEERILVLEALKRLLGLPSQTRLPNSLIQMKNKTQ
jgi:pimeloyl-ACP methyl ester carboxylesterase